MCAAHIAADWGSYILQDGLPSYLRDVLGFSLTMSGILAALPTLLQALVGFKRRISLTGSDAPVLHRRTVLVLFI